MIPVAYYPQNFYRTSPFTNDTGKRKNYQSTDTYQRLKFENGKSEEMMEPSSGFMMHDILKCDIRPNSQDSREEQTGKCEETLGRRTRPSLENHTGELQYYKERAAKNTEVKQSATQRYAEAEYIPSSSTEFYRHYRTSSTVANASRSFCKSDHAFFHQKNVSPHHYSHYRSWEYSNSPSFIYHHHPNSKSCFDFERTEEGRDKQLSSDSSRSSSPFASYGFYSEYFDGKKKRTRTIFSKDQIAELEKTYASCRYLTGALREEIANKLQMSSCQVKIWFQNKRNKEKREQKTNAEDSDDSKELMREANEDTYPDEESEKQQNINSN